MIKLNTEAVEKEMNYKKYIAKDGKTFCNLYVNNVLKLHGVDIPLKLANDMIVDIEAKGEQLTLAEVKKCTDRLIVACQVNKDSHGHVAIIAYDGFVYSNKWLLMVPKVYNVGNKNGLIGLNWAFPDIPIFIGL